MKTFSISVTAMLVLLLFLTGSSSGKSVVGVVTPVSTERITIVTGDRAFLNLGTRDGLVKGDIGVITSNGDLSANGAIGKCAVTKTDYESSVCEVIKAHREIEKGDYIHFDPIRFADGNYYSVAMNTLSGVLEPYQPYDHLRVCVYGVFDHQNAVTGLSEEITAEFKRIFSQKNRIEIVSKNVLRGLVVYPDPPSDLLSFARNQMKRGGVDVLILGRYAFSGEKVEVEIQKIDKTGNDKTVTFSFPMETKYADLSAKTVVTPQEMTKAQTIPCNIVLRSNPRILQREEKAQLIAAESAGNPLVEQALRRIDFNLVSPVGVKAIIDGETVAPITKQGHVIMLSTGTHTMRSSFRRGYFFNETLLYTSDQEITKDAILTLTKDKGLVIEMGIIPSTQNDPITLTIYQPTERQHQVLKPIYRVESDKTVESFKD